MPVEKSSNGRAKDIWHTLSPMSKQLEAVYENGVLRPLQPLALADQQHVLVTVDEILDYKAWATAQLRELGPAPGLAEIQRQLSAIPGSMSEVIVEERGER
jgi:predicted DNA-binding antitoxin AbrB/MazE fold protein